MTRNIPIGEEKPKEYIPFKCDVDLADKVRLGAQAETGGNVSEYIRRALQEKIDRSLGKPLAAA